jgi:ADP-ribose pyrophosphatase YjhB (NUDIX family)
MLQMYKVFINDKPVILFGKPEDISEGFFALQSIEVKGSKSLRNVLDRHFFSNPAPEAIVLYNNISAEKLLSDFISLFWFLKASGGIVKNSRNERLFIYRFGRWDLPKGKLEKHENEAEAALREVEEETGIKGHRLISELPSTYHMYEHKGRKVLKKTFWFAMEYDGNEPLVPQLEEEITAADWFGADKIGEILSNTYTSLFDLIEADVRLRG